MVSELWSGHEFKTWTDGQTDEWMDLIIIGVTVLEKWASMLGLTQLWMAEQTDGQMERLMEVTIICMFQC